MNASVRTYDRLVKMYGERYKCPDWKADKTGNTPSAEPRLPVVSRKELDKFFEAFPTATDEDALNYMKGQVGSITRS